VVQRETVVCMFRRSRAEEIAGFFALPIATNEVAVFYLGVSGLVARTASHAVLFDPAGFLKDDEITALKGVNLLLFTHNHLDHFSAGKTQALFRATGASVLAEAKVAATLKGKIPADKLVSAESGKNYTFGDVSASTILGVHRGPIMLYQVKLDGVSLFHAGDSGYVSLKDYPSDVAFLPTGRMSPTASPENAYKMTVDLKPDVAVAVHGSGKQKREFEAKVKEGLPQTSVLILEPFTSKKIVLLN
jgi:L-ascorbate metabolism protein UlaG (beta-lactamase superfamily)